MRTDTLDSMSPDEAHLPPSARTWARIIRLPGGWDALELRDPNSGQDPDPATKPRHQYLVREGYLFTRRLPPAPLAEEPDESPWRDDPSASRWRLAEPRGLPWAWALEQDSCLRPYATAPAHHRVERDIHGDGGNTYDAYTMPPQDPWGSWAAITDCPCPVPGCGQTLVWWEAGYVPGYRVCMALSGDGQRYDRDTLRHRFVLDHRERKAMVLIREHDRENDIED